ncbi:hypothetical protein AB0I98_13740 [Streptomyces sp. NPDC050211]|uniref:MmyB family transcriptional regulator n=1 Tax=Streptomyces sp. NPDC050211 TaxID=3154932 RepID=UPI003446C480
MATGRTSATRRSPVASHRACQTRAHARPQQRPVLDPDFRAWWAEHRVSSARYGTRRHRHHLAGALTVSVSVGGTASSDCRRDWPGPWCSIACSAALPGCGRWP